MTMYILPLPGSKLGAVAREMLVLEDQLNE